MKDPLEEYKYKEKLELKQQLPSLNKLAKICCPSCKTAAPSTNININDKLAKCDTCDGVFSFQDNEEAIHHASTTSEILQPAGVELFHFQNELDISFDKPSSLKALVLAGCFLVLSLEFIGIGSITSVSFLTYLSIPFFIFAMLLIIAVFLTRNNKTYVTIDEEYLSVVNRPVKLPFAKEQFYKVGIFDQVYVKKYTPAGKDAFMIYAIINTAEGQKHIKLTPSIKGKSKAKYIEQEIERHLGITNRPVPEEEK